MKKIINLLFLVLLLTSCAKQENVHTCSVSGEYGGYDVVVYESNDKVNKEEYTFYYDSNYLKDFNFEDFRSAYNYLRDYYIDSTSNINSPNLDSYYTNSNVVVKLTIDFTINDLDKIVEAGYLESDQIYNDYVSYKASVDLFGLQCE